MAVLQRFLDAQQNSAKFGIEYSPFLGGAAHWHFSRQHSDPRALISAVLITGSGRDGNEVRGGYPEIRRSSVRINASVDCLAPLAREVAGEDGFVHLMGDDVEV